MRFPIRSFLLALGLSAAIASAARPCVAQTAGAIEFTARVTPTDGRPEPVRQLTFFLIHKSLTDIRKEAESADPLPDLAKFADSLDVSPELKAWMKKNHTVELAGPDFFQRLTPDDVVNVPEFLSAYLSGTAGLEGLQFPKPKFKERDRQANPEKYKQQVAEFHEAVKRFITAEPDTTKGMDLPLDSVNPAPAWNQKVAEQKRRVDRRVSELAQTRYLAAQTDTDLEGHGAFSGLAPGDYWLTTLGMPAMAGDVRLKWDLPVAVQSGVTTRVALSNLNAVEPAADRQ